MAGDDKKIILNIITQQLQIPQCSNICVMKCGFTHCITV